MVPLSSTRSPGRAFEAEISTPSGTTPIPAVVTNIRSAEPLFTTLVSPVAMATPAAAAARAIDCVTRARSSSGKPSSRMNAAERQTGRAPLIARSFTVPFTASSPMSPPGKNSGVTTNASVVKAIRPPSIEITAWSSSLRSQGLSKAGRKISRISCALSFPPLPCPSTTVLRGVNGGGQESVKSFGMAHQVTSVVVIGGAGPLGRNHGGAQRRLGRALFRERRAVVRLLHALQHQPADARLRLLGPDAFHFEPPPRVELLKLRPQPVAALRDHADAPPRPVAGLEHLEHPALRLRVAFPRDRPGILILHFRASLCELPHGHQNPSQQVHLL